MPIKELAILLLIGHIGSVFFISFVLKRQWGLLKYPINKNLKHFRLTLFFLALAILIGNFIPIVIDALTLFVNLGRPSHIKPISIAYSLSIAIVEFISAYLIWTLYRLAADTKDITDYENGQLNK